DSITADISKPEKLALTARLARIQSVGITNKLNEQYAKILERDISYNTLSENLKLVNSSLSSVIFQYNIYITAKNKQFKKPQWSDPQLSCTMDLLKTNILSCSTWLETTKIVICIYLHLRYLLISPYKNYTIDAFSLKLAPNKDC
ncbi:MAG TPA: hypothetical protein VGN64_25135, partial [Dyadobacter sp.]|nr:hypothetical protein [Dyadobacter sp.]